VLNSDLPDEEKSDARLGDEAQLILSAGLLTTSWALTVGSFHITASPLIHQKLIEELQASGIGLTAARKWYKPAQLPYLHAVVRESIRLAYSLPHRNPRLSPDAEIRYNDWVILRNTPVSITNLHVLLNEDVFPSPTEFIPERWIGNPGLEKYFVAFGKGSRACLGQE
jgi:cytochrome P450